MKIRTFAMLAAVTALFASPASCVTRKWLRASSDTNS